MRQGCILAPTHCTSCIDHVLGRISENSRCGVSSGTSRITDIDFAEDAGIFAETAANITAQVHAEAFDSLSEETEPFELQSSGSKPRSRHSVTSWMRPLSQFL